LLETYLDYRQHKQYQITKLPKQLAGIIEEEAFTKAQAYGLTKRYYLNAILALFLNFVQQVWVLLLCL